MIIEAPRRRGYQLHAPDSPEAEALLSERGLTRADLDRALAELERTEGIQIRTIVGINDDGVFGTRREGWRPDLPDACAEPFIPLLWLQVLELLGRVPKGSTAKFLEDGTLPPDAMTPATTVADSGVVAATDDDGDPTAAGRLS
jgi:hypothetical protein